MSKQSWEKQQASRRLSSLYINKHLDGKDGDYWCFDSCRLCKKCGAPFDRMGSKMISLDLHGEDELFKLKMMGKWKWIPWTLKKPGKAWQTSPSFRYSFDLFNVFPCHLFIYPSIDWFIYLFISTFWGHSLLLLTCDAFPLWLNVANGICWHLLYFESNLLDVHKETHQSTVILVDNSYWSLPSPCRWKYQWLPVIAAKWNAFPRRRWRRRVRSNCHSRFDWTLRSVGMMIHYIYTAYMSEVVMQPEQ